MNRKICSESASNPLCCEEPSPVFRFNASSPPQFNSKTIHTLQCGVHVILIVQTKFEENLERSNSFVAASIKRGSTDELPRVRESSVDSMFAKQASYGAPPRYPRSTALNALDSGRLCKAAVASSLSLFIATQAQRTSENHENDDWGCSTLASRPHGNMAFPLTRCEAILSSCHPRSHHVMSCHVMPISCPTGVGRVCSPDQQVVRPGPGGGGPVLLPAAGAGGVRVCGRCANGRIIVRGVRTPNFGSRGEFLGCKLQVASCKMDRSPRPSRLVPSPHDPRAAPQYAFALRFKFQSPFHAVSFRSG